MGIRAEYLLTAIAPVRCIFITICKLAWHFSVRIAICLHSIINLEVTRYISKRALRKSVKSMWAASYQSSNCLESPDIVVRLDGGKGTINDYRPANICAYYLLLGLEI